MKKKQKGGGKIWEDIKKFAKKHKTTIAITLGVLAIIGGGVATKKYIDKKKNKRDNDKRWVRTQAIDTLHRLTGMGSFACRKRIEDVHFQHGSEGVKEFIKGHDNHARMMIDAGKINKKARELREDKNDNIIEKVEGLMEKLQKGSFGIRRVGGKRRSSKRRRSKKQRSKRRRSKKR